MKQLNYIGFFATVTMLVLACQKECLDPPKPCYFADLTLKEKQGIEYTLLIDNAPVTSWKGDTASQVRTIDISERYKGVPADFRVRAEIDLGGPNIDVLKLYSNIFRDSVEQNSPELIEIVDQSSTGTLAVKREGGRNRILVRNSSNCPQQARLIYNGRDTLLNLADRNAGTQGGSDYVFYTEGDFDISFQLLTPCGFYQTHDVLKVSSSKIVPFEFDLGVKVRKEDCNSVIEK